MDAKKLGEFIAGCRKEKKMTQAELAVKINVTDKAVSRWERGFCTIDNKYHERYLSAVKGIR